MKMLGVFALAEMPAFASSRQYGSYGAMSVLVARRE